MMGDSLVVYTNGVLPIGSAEVINARDEAIAAADRAEEAIGSGTIASLAGLTGAANQMPYWTGAGVMASTALTPSARTLLGSSLLSVSGNNLVTTESARLTGGAVVSSNVDATPNRLLRTGAFGIGGVIPSFPGNDLSVTDNSVATGLYRADGISGMPPTASRGSVIHTRRAVGGGETQLLVSEVPSAGIVYARSRVTGDWSEWSTQYSTANTTVDSNGFIKSASPIVRMFADRTEEPVEYVGASLVRHGVGSYTLSGVPPLATEGWQIEVPQDHNGNRLVFVETSYTGDTLTVTTSKPVWSMDTMSWVAGEPRDIPAGRWVDLRFWKGPTLEPEDE